MREERVRSGYGSYVAQHDEYRTICTCEHCGYYLGDKNATHPAAVRKLFDEDTNFCPKCGKPLYHMFGEKVSVIEQVISDIEDELEVSTSTTYQCKDGEIIGTDVGYVWSWFNLYKGCLEEDMVDRPIERLSGDYIRGYTKAIQDITEIFWYIQPDLKHHHKSLNAKLAEKLLSAVLKHREEVREGFTGDGFIRWNNTKQEFEWFCGKERSNG